MLLDIPWVATAQSGWPLFGLLGTINMRKGQIAGALNTIEVDGLSDASGQQLQGELAVALQAADMQAVERAGTGYLQRSGAGQGSALAPMTALAMQALGSAPAEKVNILQGLQAVFKQVIGTSAELDVALSTNWPLWGLVQLSLEGFAA